MSERMPHRLVCAASVIVAMLGCTKSAEISESRRYQISDCRRLIASFAGQDAEVAERSMQLKQLGCTSITTSETEAYLRGSLSLLKRRSRSDTNSKWTVDVIR